MKFINLYPHPRLHNSDRFSYVATKIMIGSCISLAAYTGYLLFDLYRLTQAQRTTAQTLAPALARAERMKELTLEQQRQVLEKKQIVSPFTILSGLKSSQTYLQRATLTSSRLTIELYYPVKNSISQLITQCAQIAGVTHAELIAIRSHTPEQRALTLVLTLA